jgi:hypothetical protein
MRRAALLVLAVMVSSVDARAEGTPRCPPRDPTPIPPIASKPKSKASLARALALVNAPASSSCDAGAGDAELETTLARLREAIRDEPALIAARTALVSAIADSVHDHPDPVLSAWKATLLVQLRDAGLAGCKECIGYLSDVRKFERLWDGQEADAFWGSIANGPPGRLGDAARAVLHGMLAGDESDGGDPKRAWKEAAKYLDDGPIRLVEGFNGSGGDPPQPTTTKTTLKGKRGLEKWLEKQADRGDMPGPGDTLWCSGHCCTLPFIDYNPHMHRFSGLCFDAGLHLRQIATDSSGM